MKATTAIRSLFRKKQKHPIPSTPSTQQITSSSVEHLAQSPSLPGHSSLHEEQAPAPAPRLKHKRSGALVETLPVIVASEEPLLSPELEPFPRYSHSMDIERYGAQFGGEHLYPQIVVTPASIDGNPGDRDSMLL